jgi:hypothetical protein
MSRFVLTIIASLLVGSTSCSAQPAAASENAAQKAAEDILQSLSNGEFKTVWDKKVSRFIKDRTSEDAFLSNMSMGRPTLGKLQSFTLVSREHASRDPASGFIGDIYSMTFRSKYPTGEFYERIVVLKEADGAYRLSGIGGSPVPK